MSLLHSLQGVAALRAYPALAVAGGAVQGSAAAWRTHIHMSSQVLVAKQGIDFGRMLRMVRNALACTVVFLLVGNLTIFGAWKLMSKTEALRDLPDLPGIHNLAEVDSGLWRGSAPTRAGYAALAEKGVKTIIDLRAEHSIKVDETYLASLGIDRVSVPVRDGQAPNPEQIATVMRTIEESDGLVYLHCGAGVGRTGTMAAAYLVQTGQASAREALARNLAVGPPSLEQIAFAATLEEGEMQRPNALITGISRLLDAPRRILVNVRNSYE